MTLPIAIIAKPELDIAHNAIHTGTFFSRHKISMNLLVVNPKRFLFITSPLSTIPSGITFTHLVFVVSCDRGVKIEFFEGAVTSFDGNLLDTINQNRTSTNITDDEAYEDPIVTLEGTKLYEELIGSTTSGGTGGLTSRNETELVLASGTKYLLKITPLIDGVNITTHIRDYDARASLQ